MSIEGDDPVAGAQARHDRLTRLVGEARRLPPAERDAFLDVACPDDTDLRAEAASYLAELGAETRNKEDFPEIQREAQQVVGAFAGELAQPSPSRADDDSFDDPPESEPSRFRSVWFWLGCIITVALAALYIIKGSELVRIGSDERLYGWRWANAGQGWMVTDVSVGGPADGHLQVGDRVVEVAGLPLVETRWIGPWDVLRWQPVKRPYSVVIEREGVVRTTALPIELIRSKYLVRSLIALLNSTVMLVVAALLIVGKPRDATARLGALGIVLTSALNFGNSLTSAGISPVLAILVSNTCFPWNWLVQYHFLSRFPVQIRAGRSWRWLDRLVNGFAILIWLPFVVSASVKVRIISAGPSLADAAIWMQRDDWLRMLFRRFLNTASSIYLAFVAAAMIAVLIRNYRLLPEGDARRRIRLVAATAGSICALWVIQGIWLGLAQALGRPDATHSRALYKRVLDSTPVLTYLAFGYALLKHRVLDLKLTIRASVQYLLATNVLRLATAVPAAWILYTVLSRPDRTVSELIEIGALGPNLLLLSVAGVALTFRAPLRQWIDLRLFREAYDQEQVLLGLVDSIKQRESIPELLEAVSREIDAALHVERIAVLLRTDHDGDLIPRFTSDGSAVRPLPSISRLGSLIGSNVRLVDDPDRDWEPSDMRWLRHHRVEVVVPVQAFDGGLLALLLLGPKKSEMPYTGRDRELLLTIATQLGSACEVIALRQQVDSGRRVQEDVLDRLTQQQVHLLLECPQCGRCGDAQQRRCPDDQAELRPTVPVERTIEGKYRLERRIGSGGMATVYAATDLRLRRPVAIKVMHGRLFGSGASLRRFTREAQVVARMEHPGIIRVFDYGPLRGEGAYLVLELVDGISWQQRLVQCGRMSPSEVAALLDALLDAMTDAHAAGIVHRDLKPANILILPADRDLPTRLKVLDFGLAKIREAGYADPKSETATGVTLGTLGYMSPEQYRGGKVDHRTDIYAIGVLTLVSLTGPLPPVTGGGYHETTESELARRLAGPSARVDQREVARCLARCLAFDQERRYPSVTEVRAALVPALRRCEALSEATD